VMAVWGYPVAREDDALRAVRAALGIRDGLAGAGRDMHARIGINTGEAVVAFGSADEDADDAMGDAVNVAARLAAAAEIDGIVAGETTAHLAGDGLVAEAMPPLALKGKAEPVVAVTVLGLVEPGAGAAAHLPMVGREAELEALRSDLTAARSAVVRRLVTGEPGIGKSRLLAEVRRASTTEAPDTRWYIGRCRDEVRSPGQALGDVLKAWAGISDGDEPDVGRARLEAAIPETTPDRAWLLDRLAPLAGLDSRSAADPAERETAWIRLLGLVAADGPAVVLVEDVHWADDALVAALTSPSVEALAAPLALLMTGRPEAAEDRPELGTAAIRQLALEPLPLDAAAALASAAGSGLDPARAAAIAERGGGNPLFTAELVRLAAQRGDAAVATLPDTVQAVISARLDLLDPGVRDVAQRAAVVGPVFWPGALAAAASGTVADVDAALHELRTRGMVRPIDPSPLPGHRAFGFRHALFRDAAYGRLTRGARMEAHAATARWLAGQVPADRGDLAGIVADHYLAALDVAAAGGGTVDPVIRAEAIEALLGAAGHTGSDPEIAAGRWIRAIELMAPDDERRWAATASAATALSHAGRSLDGVRLVDQALDEAPADLDPSHLVELLNASALVSHWAGDDYLVRLTEAERLLGAIPIGPAHVDAAVARALWENRHGSRQGVMTAAAEAIRLSERLGVAAPVTARVLSGYARYAAGDPGGADAMAAVGADALRAGQWSQAINAGQQWALANLYLGRYEVARGIALDSLDLARARGLPFMEIRSLYALTVIDYATGHWAEVANHRERVLALAVADPSSMEPGYLSILWRVLDAQGDETGADRVVERLDALFPEATLFSSLDLEPILLVRVARRGDPDKVAASAAAVYHQDPDELDPAIDPLVVRTVREVARHGFPSEAHELAATIDAPSPLAVLVADTMRGTLALADGDPAEAARVLEDAAARWDAFGCVPFAAEARIDLGDALLRLGRTGEARAALAASRAAFEPLGARRYLDEIAALEALLA